MKSIPQAQQYIKRLSCRHNGFKKQQGIATILVVVLVGVAMTGAALGIVHSMKASQQKQLAAHAVTHAQASLWTGVEAFRRYLGTLDDAGVLALANETKLDIGMSAIYGELSAEAFAIEDVGNSTYRISTTIVSRHTAAKASSALGIVFEVNMDDCPDCTNLSGSIDFYDDLDIGGQIIFNMPDGSRPDLNVDGSISMSNVSITQLGRVNSTSSVYLNSAVVADEIYANDDVTLDQSATAGKVSTLGDFKTGGGGYTSIVWANGNVNYGSSGKDSNGYTSTAINAIGNITITDGWHDLIKAGGTLAMSTSHTVDDAQSVGDASFSQWGIFTSIKSEGNVTCVSTAYDRPSTIQANGTFSNCPASKVSNPTPAIDIAVMSPLTAYSMQQFVVDVWKLKSKANFVFEWDTVNQATKVTLYNIAGVADGSEYYVGDATGKKSHLCKVVPSSKGNKSTCPDAEATDIALCLGFTINNSCISYSTPDQRWTVEGTAAAPGVMWFDGNLLLSSGMNYTTVLATGDVTTAGNLKVKSVNYSGYQPICAGNAPDIVDGQYPLHTNYRDLFSNQYPTNLCDSSGGTYKPEAVGNIAVAAGGYDPSLANVYDGGNISLDAANDIYGSVLAGSILNTKGSTTVHGYITSAALSPTDKISMNNDLGGSTTIDLMNLPSSYNPTQIPDMSDQAGQNNQSGERSKVLWSRYL